MDWTSDYVLSIIVTVIITLLSTIGNLALIIVFIIKQQLRTTSNYFIMGLLVVDLILGLLYPVQTLSHLKVISSNPECVVLLCILLMLGIIASFALLSLTIERYIMISRPLKADSIITLRRYFIATCIATVYAAIVAILPAISPIGNREPGLVPQGCRFHTIVPSAGYRFFIFANRFLPLPIMIILYVKIFLLVRKHAHAVAAQITTSNPSREPSGTERNARGNDHNNDNSVQEAFRRKYKFKTEAKSALLLFIIVAYFIITWIPFTIILFQQNVSENVNQMIYTISNMFAFSNCVVNPLIYGVGNRAFRHALQRVFCGRLASVRRMRHLHQMNTFTVTRTSPDQNLILESV